MNPDDTLSFESAYARLEEILEKMNSGKVSLEDSLKLYEEADSLIGRCNKQLTAAEKKIEMLIKNRDGEIQIDASGKPQTQAFIPGQTAQLNRTIS